MEDEWCTYGTGMYRDIGKVVGEYSNGSILTIRTSGGQVYPAEDWDTKYVSRFGALLDAIKDYAEWEFLDMEEVLYTTEERFPTQLKLEMRRSLIDTLKSYKEVM